MKRIAFFISSNGYGHYDRCKTIASYLEDDYVITFFSNFYQYDKIGPPGESLYFQLRKETIRWDKNIKQNKIRFKSYKEGLKERKFFFRKHDLVISDNIVGILKYRPDAIISGSFLWKDIFLEKFGKNKLSDFDKELLDKHNPLMLTNKYFEVGSVKEYKNKKQFGFGCPSIPFKLNKINKIVFIKPSLNYLDSYKNFEKKLAGPYTTDINVTDNVVMVARPGGGIITHCVKHHIPLIALYDENDSSEILELAQKVEDLGIGIKQNVNENLNNTFFKDNSIYNSIQLTKDGYKETADYIKTLVI